MPENQRVPETRRRTKQPAKTIFSSNSNHSSMATGWIKSLNCKSQAFADVYPSIPTKHFSLPHHSGCTRSLHNLKDVVDNAKKKTHRESTRVRIPSTPNQQQSISRARTSEPFFPTLTELPAGHSSRNIVELIFHNSWHRSPSGVSGSIELLFKVQNLPKTVARFEEYREMVKTKSRAESSGRSVADGNEVLRFHCVGPAGRCFDGAGGLCSFSGKGTAICTFSGSGAAHESAGASKGRRAMLVCRVIAGRVCQKSDCFYEGRGFDSVAGENGELLVFDSRALLPCFLIIYNF